LACGAKNPASKILPYGIPIKKKFSTGYEKKDARELLGISDKRTILVMMGSMGYGNIIENLHAIDSLSEDFQVICVCGNNKKAKEEISSTVWEHSVFTYGFVDNIDVMMDASDCIISKPGGLTTSEAMAKRLPMIIVDPIPGQEDRNTEFLTNNGAAMAVSHTAPLDEVLYQMLADPRRIEVMRAAIDIIRKPNSTRDICEFAKKIITEKE
jgi:processive 1,2-diacylglycerol beta-glucosyltransferase